MKTWLRILQHTVGPVKSLCILVLFYALVFVSLDLKRMIFVQYLHRKYFISQSLKENMMQNGLCFK